MPAQMKTRLNDYGIDDACATHVLLTHHHADHTNGLYFLEESRPANGFAVASKLSVFLPSGLFRTLAAAKRPDSFYLLQKVNNLESFSVGSLRVTPMETNHLKDAAGGDRESFGYLLESSDASLAYLVDASSNLPDTTIDVLRACTISCLVYDCTFANRQKSRGHADIDAGIALKRLLRPHRMILTHISHRNYGHDELVRRLRDHAIDVAWDGMTVEL